MLKAGLKQLTIFAALLAMLGSGFAMSARADDAPPAEKKSDAKGDTKPGDKSSFGKNHYIKIPPLILPVIGDNGVEQIISLVVIIEATSDDAGADITALVPRLNDGFVTALYGSVDRREHMKNGVIDVNFLKQKLLAIAIKIAGADKVKDVLIQGVAQHQS